MRKIYIAVNTALFFSIAKKKEKRTKQANNANAKVQADSARREAYNRKYNELVAQPERDREAWIESWEVKNSDNNRVLEALEEAEKAVSRPDKYNIPAQASEIGYRRTYTNIYALGLLYGIDFLHDKDGNPIPLKEISARLKGEGKYKGQPEYYTETLSKKFNQAKLKEDLPERIMPEVPSSLDIDYESIEQLASEYAEATVPEAKAEELPDFYTWAYRQGKIAGVNATMLINKAVTATVAKEQQKSSEGDIFRAVDIFNQEFGGDPSKLQAKIGDSYNIEGATISSRNEKQSSGVNRYVLELNVKTDKGTKKFTIWDKYGLSGFEGERWGTVDASGDGWSLTNLNGQGMANSQGE